MDTIVVMPAVCLLQILLGFSNATQHPQTVFRKPIQLATHAVKEPVTIYTPSAPDKAIYLPRKLQQACEMTRISLSEVASKVDS